MISLFGIRVSMVSCVLTQSIENLGILQAPKCLPNDGQAHQKSTRATPGGQGAL